MSMVVRRQKLLPEAGQKFVNISSLVNHNPKVLTYSESVGVDRGPEVNKSGRHTRMLRKGIVAAGSSAG